jgi:hypothetical protein
MRRAAAVVAVMLVPIVGGCTETALGAPSPATVTTTVTIERAPDSALLTAPPSTVTVTVTRDESSSAGFGTKTLDNASVEGPDGIEKVLTASGTGGYGLTGVGLVSCPDEMKVIVGAAYDCTVMINGRPQTVTITIKTTDGQYEVGAPH